MTMHIRLLAAAVMALLCAPVCHATLISYSATNVAGTTWRYDYSITNDTLGHSIDEFTIFFDRTLYANLAVAQSPADWDSIVIQPDHQLPDDGFFDSLGLNTGVSAASTLGGFSAFFDWLGVGTPGAQAFHIVDPLSFEVLDSGLTSLLLEEPTPVPEPSSLMLLALGLAMLAIVRRQREQSSLA